MKQELIQIRVSKKFKDLIEKTAEKNEVTLSEYVRAIIKTAIDNKTKI
jgi:uncharacterized protein (DUF1778 family)